MKTGQQIRAT